MLTAGGGLAPLQIPSLPYNPPVIFRRAAMLYRRFASALVLLALLVALGACGYVWLEGWSFADGLYMTVITVGTIGYSETNPLSPLGRNFTMLLILFSTGAMVYATSSLTAIIVEGELQEIFKRRKMKKFIAALSGHYIVCGDSVTCSHIIEELQRTEQSFVVIDLDPAKVRTLAGRNIAVLQGDATQDATLREAGIERAAGLLTCLQSDAENLFVVLSARRLNPQLRIVTKAVAPASRDKLKQVGADSVVLTKAIGGLRMASELMRPHVVNFLDEMLRAKDATIRVEEIVVAAASPTVGNTLAQTPLRTTPGASLVALIRNSQYHFNPLPEFVIASGDVLILLGDTSIIQGLRRDLGLSA